MNGLRVLNFRDLINLGLGDARSYTFDLYRKNGFEHPRPKSYCVSCDNKGWHRATDGSRFKLRNISHGAHTTDFLASLTSPPDTKGWHHEPVMFLYESPAGGETLYKRVAYRGHSKAPTKEWFWVHGDNAPVTFPHGFQGGVYGQFVFSAIMTFRLANPYVTNLVKCGMNDSKGTQFRNLACYSDECVENCYKRFLDREMAILKPRLLFAVGSSVEDRLIYLTKRPVFIQQLPHPAGRRRGFRDEHFKVLYFWLVLRALHKTEIFATTEVRSLTEQFLTRYDAK